MDNLERDELANTVDGLAKSVVDFNGKLDTAKTELRSLASEIYLEGKSVSMAKFTSAKSKLDFYTFLVAEGRPLLKDARYSLWCYDLDALEKDYKSATQTCHELRQAVARAQTDKGLFLKETSKRCKTPEYVERLANLDIALADARSRSQVAVNQRDRVKAELQAMKADYNELARVEGWPLEVEPAPLAY